MSNFSSNNDEFLVEKNALSVATTKYHSSLPNNRHISTKTADAAILPSDGQRIYIDPRTAIPALEATIHKKNGCVPEVQGVEHKWRIHLNEIHSQTCNLGTQAVKGKCIVIRSHTNRKNFLPVESGKGYLQDK